MANRAGNDLLYRRLAARQTRGIIFRGKITNQRRDLVPAMQNGQSFLQKCSLARAGTGNQADDQHTCLAKTFAQGARDDVVLLEHIFSNLHQAWFGAHSAISSANTSNSLP